jgi:hypothetical protein
MTLNIRVRFWQVVALLLVVSFMISFGQPIDAKKSSSPSPDLADNFTYLPLSMKNAPWRTVFGTQVKNLGDEAISSLAVDAGIDWARLDSFNWSYIEPQRTDPPTYKWNQVDQKSIKAARENGIQAIAIVRGAPEWARKYSGISCGPIKQDQLDEFASFMFQLVKR